MQLSLFQKFTVFLFSKIHFFESSDETKRLTSGKKQKNNLILVHASSGNTSSYPYTQLEHVLETTKDLPNFRFQSYADFPDNQKLHPVLRMYVKDFCFESTETPRKRLSSNPFSPKSKPKSSPDETYEIQVCTELILTNGRIFVVGLYEKVTSSGNLLETLTVISKEIFQDLTPLIETQGVFNAQTEHKNQTKIRT